MMKKVFKNVNIPLPENYADKIRQLQRKVAASGINKQASSKSLFSMMSRNHMSSTKKSFLSDDEEMDDDFQTDDDLLLDNASQTVAASKKNPLLTNINQIFVDISQDIKKQTEERI